MGLKKQKDEPKDFDLRVTDYKLIVNEDGKKVYVSVSEAEDIEALRLRRQQVTSFKPAHSPVSSDTEAYQSAVDEAADKEKKNRPVPKRRKKIKEIALEVKAKPVGKKTKKKPGYFDRKFRKVSKTTQPKSLIYTDYKLVVTPNGKKVYVSPEEAEAIDAKQRVETEEVVEKPTEVNALFKMADTAELTPPEEIIQQDLQPKVRERGSIFSSFMRGKKPKDDGLTLEKLEEKDESVRNVEVKRGLFSWLSFSRKSKIKPAVSDGELKDGSPKLRRNFSLPVIWKKGDRKDVDVVEERVKADKRDKRSDNQPNAVMGLIGVFGSQDLGYDEKRMSKKKKKVKRGITLIGDADDGQWEVTKEPRSLLMVFGSGDLNRRKMKQEEGKLQEESSKRKLKSLFGSGEVKEKKKGIEVDVEAEDESEDKIEERRSSREKSPKRKEEEPKKEKEDEEEDKSDSYDEDKMDEKQSQRQVVPKRTFKSLFTAGEKKEPKEEEEVEGDEKVDLEAKVEKRRRSREKSPKRTFKSLFTTERQKNVETVQEESKTEPEDVRRSSEEVPERDFKSLFTSIHLKDKKKKPSKPEQVLENGDDEEVTSPKRSFKSLFNNIEPKKPVAEAKYTPKRSFLGRVKSSEDKEITYVRNSTEDANENESCEEALPKHTKKTQEDTSNVPKKPKKSKKHTNKTAEDSSNILKKLKMSKKPTKKNPAFQLTPIDTDSDDSHDEDPHRNSRNESSHVRNSTEDTNENESCEEEVPKHTKKTQEDTSNVPKKPKKSKKHTSKTAEDSSNILKKLKMSKKPTKKNPAFQLTAIDTDSDDSHDEEPPKNSRKENTHVRNSTEDANENESCEEALPKHTKKTQEDTSNVPKKPKKSKKHTSKTAEGSSNILKKLKMSKKPTKKNPAFQLTAIDTDSDDSHDEDPPKNSRKGSTHVRNSTEDAHENESCEEELPKHTKKTQEDTSNVPKKPKKSKKHTSKTVEGSSNILKKLKMSKKPTKKNPAFQLTAIDTDSDDSHDEEPPKNSRKESTHVRNSTEDANENESCEEALPKHTKKTQEDTSNVLKKPKKSKKHTNKTPEDTSNIPKKSKKTSKKTPKSQLTAIDADSDDSHGEDLPKNSKKSLLAIFGSHSKSSKINRSATDIHNPKTVKFGSAPSVFEPKTRKSILSVFERPTEARQSLPNTHSRSDESLTSVDTNQETQTGFYDLENNSPQESLYRPHPAGIWGPRKRSRTDYCYLGDEPERVSAPDIILRGFKTFDDDGRTLLRGKVSSDRRRPLSLHQESMPKVLSVRRFSYDDDCKILSDTESADHGSTDKTSVTKLTQDNKKRRFNFMELIKRGKDKEPAVIAEAPKDIVIDGSHASNGDRVVYAELDMVRGVEASAALRRDNDPDKTEYAEIIHPNPPISKKEELRRSRENLVDPSAEPTTASKKEAAV